jgi:hypothetical protein
MYKNLSIALLIVAFGLVAIRSTGTQAPMATSPIIITKRRLVNQTAPIPTTTIFTSTHDGVYRLSVYATITQADPSSDSNWEWGAGWTDDAGAEISSSRYVASDWFLGQFGVGGLVTIIEAKAGTPITYSMSQRSPADNSAYNLYYVLEQIE